VVVEYVDHLHEHFVDPVRTSAGRYLAPRQPGYSAEMRRETLAEFTFPDGPVWRYETPPARVEGVSVVPPTSAR